MLTLLLAFAAMAAQDKGLLGLTGSLCAAGLGLVGWLDKRIRTVEKDTALNTATVASMDKKIDRLLDFAEDRRARD